MSNIVPVKFEDHDITVMTDDNGEPWFLAKEVADVLGYSEASAMTRSLDNDEKGLQVVQTLGGRQRAITINESGLYSVILGSEKPEAKRFKRWVTHEVLPSIRKTGRYTASKPSSGTQTGLVELRRARALEMATKTAERIVAQFPSLSEDSRRVVFAKVINPVAGVEVLALPRVEQKHYQAGEVGDMLGISGAMVGRIANQNGLKTEQHGYFRLDKSAHSAKQVETFVYNDKGVESIRTFMPSMNVAVAPKAQATRELQPV